MTEDENIGIWKYKKHLPKIHPENRISLGEGNTTLIEIQGIYFKNEQENPTGSVKDRGIACQISYLLEHDIKKAVISSSGNAAISAAYYCKQAGIDLTVFISTSINLPKLKRLEKLDIEIVQGKRPVSSAFRYAQANKFYNLRQSKDKNAIFGYQTLGLEIGTQLKKVDAVFIPVSSGATLVGLEKGLKIVGINPAIHIVQTEMVFSISVDYDKNFQESKTSLADSIVARYTPLKDQVKKIIKKSRGFGWVISDKEILKARKWLRNEKINCSFEGCAVLASLWKAERHKYKYKNPVCILTGRNYDE